jgi:hypothetical protein
MEEGWELRLLGAVRLCDVILGLRYMGRDVEVEAVRAEEECLLDRKARVGRRSDDGIVSMCVWRGGNVVVASRTGSDPWA